MVVAFISFRGLELGLRLSVRHLLLLGAHQDVRPVSNLLLLRADQRAVSGCRHRVWHHGLPRSTSICLSNLQGYERRLSHCVALSLAKNEVPTHEHLNKINKSDGTLKEMNALFAPAQILLRWGRRCFYLRCGIKSGCHQVSRCTFRAA